MNFMIYLLTILLSFSVAQATERSLASSPPNGKELLKKIEAHINLAIQNRLFPGLCLGIVKKDKVLHKKCYGTREGKNQTTPDSFYDLASVTKIFTTLRLLQLMEQEKIKLNNPYQNYVPAFTGENKELVTIERILRHQGGLRAIAPEGYVTRDYNQSLNNIFQVPLKYMPGSTTVYSDLSLILIGYLIESIDTKTLAKNFSEDLFPTLGMTSTKYHFELSDNDKKKLAPSINDNLIVAHDPYARLLIQNGLGHAGLFSTLEDMISFLSSLLSEKPHFLSKQTLELMTSPVSTSPRGLGVDITSPMSDGPRGEIFTKGESYGHTGFTGPMFWVDKKMEAGLVVLCNRTWWSDNQQALTTIKEFRYQLSTLVAQLIQAN